MLLEKLLLKPTSKTFSLLLALKRILLFLTWLTPCHVVSVLLHIPRSSLNSLPMTGIKPIPLAWPTMAALLLDQSSQGCLSLLQAPEYFPSSLPWILHTRYIHCLNFLLSFSSLTTRKTAVSSSNPIKMLSLNKASLRCLGKSVILRPHLLHRTASCDNILRYTMFYVPSTTHEYLLYYLSSKLCSKHSISF